MGVTPEPALRVTGLGFELLQYCILRGGLPVPPGHACLDQRAASAAGGRRQQSGSGQRDFARAVVSRPRNHFTCAYGTPRLIENTPSFVPSA